MSNKYFKLVKNGIKYNIIIFDIIIKENRVSSVVFKTELGKKPM